MKLSDSQERAVEHINKITEHFGKDRWFTQTEVIGAGYHTMEALVTKKILRSQYFEKVSYYQLIMVNDGKENIV
jgi:hypothetical protein